MLIFDPSPRLTSPPQRLIKDGIKRREYEGKYDVHDKRLKSMESEAKWAKTSGNKRELFGGATSRNGNGEYSAEQEGDAMLDKADSLQDKTAESLQHTRQMVDATKDVAAATLEELDRQRNQINEITEEVEQIEDNLSKADKLIKSFSRRIATDRCEYCWKRLAQFVPCEG